MREPLPKAVELQMEAARALGLACRVLDPAFGFLFEISDGRRRRLLIGGRSPLNDSVAARVAGDKHYSKLVLADAGFRVPAAVRCIQPGHYSSPEIESAAGLAPGLAFAEASSFPLIVKPNRKSHGRGVTEVTTPDELADAVRAVWRIDPIALVEERAQGLDVRIDFLDGEFLIGYLRRPLELVGDGRSSVRDLLAAADPRMQGEAAWERIERDATWRRRVTDRGLGPESVLTAGRRVVVGGTVLNLHRWAVAELLPELPPGLAGLGRSVGETIGLRFYGIDCKVPRLDAGPAEVTVIEVNASPLLTGMAEIGWREEALAAQIRVIEAAWKSAARSG
ncbi:MAG: hypothetical protein R3325_05495 [Thermoanaerobaculia bacterium]|nr:hypothetical protein [Thermoanaerobaculia bacterium]